MTTLIEKGQKFRDLHLSGEPFVLANAWDAGSARMLEQVGHIAIGTTSAGFAFSEGGLDNLMGSDEIIENGRIIAEATNLPVSGDLENGFGDTPEAAAKTMTLAAKAGMVGGSIEDSTNGGATLQYELAQAKDRVVAAVEAARSVAHPFTVTARAENYLIGQTDIGDVITRLQHYQEAGADVLYAPGVIDPNEVRQIVSSVDRPVNVVVGLSGIVPTVDAFKKMGVARLSIGSAFARLAYGEVIRSAESILESGSFTSLKNAMPYGEIFDRLKS